MPLLSSFASIFFSHIKNCKNFGRIIAIFAVLWCGSAVWGATRYWVGGTTGNWSDTSNWSTTSGGTGGASVPGTEDVAQFSNGTTATVNLDSDITVSGLNIYSGRRTITLNLNGYNLNVSPNRFNLGVSTGAPISAGNLIINGTGNVTVDTFDSAQEADCSLTLNNGVIFRITGTMYTNGTSTTTISGDSSSSFITSVASAGVITYDSNSELNIIETSSSSNIFIWTNTVSDSNWSTAGNWSTNSVPTADSIVIIPSIAGSANVSLNEASATLSSLTIASGMTLACTSYTLTSALITNKGSITSTSGAITCSGNLTNTGTISVGTLSVAGTTSNGSGGSITASDIQTFTGDVTNTGTITAGSVAANSCAIDFKGNYIGTGGTLTGSTSTNPYIDFKGDVTFGVFNANDDIVRFLGTSEQNFDGKEQSFGTIIINNSVTVSSTFTAEDVYFVTSASKTLKTCNGEAFKNLYFGGNVTIDILAGDITVENLYMQTNYSPVVPFLISNFNSKITGSNTVSVTGEIDITRVSETTGVIGSLTIDSGTTVTLADSKTFYTHSGTNLIVNGVLNASFLIHSANSNTPMSTIEVSGTLNISDTLNLSANGSSGTKLIIYSSGTVSSKIITMSDSYSNNSDTTVIENNGIINLLDNTDSLITVPTGFIFTNNKTLNISSGTVTINGTYTSSNDSVTISGGKFTSVNSTTINSLSVTTSATITGGTGTYSVTVTNATYDSSPNITTVGNVILPGGTIGDLLVGDGSTTSALTLTGSLTTSSVTINDGATLLAGANSSDAYTITVSGNWTNNNSSSGGFTAQSSTVNFTGATATISGSQTFNNVNFNGDGIVVSGSNTFANVTVTANATFSGSNSFANFTCTTGGVTLTFGAGETQTIGTFTITGASGSLITLASTATSQWNITAPSTSVSYADVSYSNSTSSITANYSISTSRHTTNWFFYPGLTYTWLGTTDTSWTETSNWDRDSVPSGTNVDDIIIATTTGGNSPVLSSALTAKSLTVNSGSSIDLANQNVTLTTFTNNGTVRLHGTQTINVNASSTETTSTIEYYGSDTNSTDVLSVSTSGNTKTYNNLVINKTGGTITFSNAVSAVSLTTNQSSSNTTGYAVVFNSTVTVTGTGDVIFGRGNDSGTTEQVDVTFKDNVAVASTDKMSFWGNVTVEKSGTLNITNAGANIYFNKSVDATTANPTSLALSANTSVQFKAPDATNKVGNNIVDFTVSNGTTSITSSTFTIQPSGNQRYIAVENTGEIIQATDKTLTITGKLTNSGTITCSSGAMSVTRSVDNSGTISGNSGAIAITQNVDNSGAITGDSGAIEIGGYYQSTGTAAFTGSSSTTTFKGTVDFRNTTFAHNSGKVVFAGTQTLTTKDDGSTTLYNVEVNNGATVTTASSFSVANNWTNNGIFNATAGKISFTGIGLVGTPIVIAGNATLANSVFYEADIQSNYVTLSGNNTFTTATFSGIGELNISGSNKFETATFTGASSLINFTGANTFTSADFSGTTSTINFASTNTFTSAIFSGATSSIHFAEANTFTNLSFTGAGSTVEFGVGKTQKVTADLKSVGSSGHEITLTTDAASPSVDSEATWWSLDIPSLVGTSILATDFNNTKVEYSKSTNDITHDWGATVTENTPASTTNWFIRTFYWYGKTDSSWTSPANWSTSSIGYTPSSFYPPYDTGLSEIIISDNDTGVLTLTDTEYKVKSIVVDAGKKVDFNGKTITATSITNNGTILMNGSESITATKTNDSNTPRSSTIEYYGTISDTTFTNGWGTDFSNIVFADGSSGTSLEVLTVAGTTQILSDAELSLTGGSTFTGTVTIDAGDAVTLSGSNTISNGVTLTAGGAVAITTTAGFSLASGATCTSLVVNGAVTLNGSVTTTGAAAQTYNDAVTLGVDTTLLAGTNTVTFNNTINSSSGNNYSLTIGNDLNATSAQFDGNVGGTPLLGNLTVQKNLTFGSYVTSFTTGGTISVTGTTAINSTSSITITSSGNQTYKGAVTLGADTTFLAGTNNTVTFIGTINSSSGNNYSLTIGNDSNVTSAQFDGNVGGTQSIGNLTVQGNLSVGSSVASFTSGGIILVTGTTAINSTSSITITSSGDQTYKDAVTLGTASNTFAAGSGNISFLNKLDANSSLTTSLTITTSGNITFGGAVGSSNALQALVIGTSSSVYPAKTAINGGSVKTSTYQTYYGPVALSETAPVLDTTLIAGSGSSITFANTILGDGTNGLIINTANLVLPSTSDVTTCVTNLPTLTFVDSSSSNAQTFTTGNQSLSLTDVVFTNTGTAATSGELNAKSVTVSGSGVITVGNNVTVNNGTLTALNITSGTFTTSGTVEIAVTGNVVVNGTFTISDTTSFKQDVSGTTPSFTVSGSSAIVTVGKNKFIVGNLTASNGGRFTQTGANSTGSVSTASDYQCVYGMETASGNGSIVWDSGSDGGFLSLNHDVSDTNIKYNNKTIIIRVIINFSGDVYSIVVPDNTTLINSGIITIRKDLTIESGGLYMHNDKPLYFVSPDSYGQGTININGSSSLGNVLISCSGIKFDSDVTFENLYFVRGELNLNGKTLTTTGDFAIWGSSYSATDSNWISSNSRWAYWQGTKIADLTKAIGSTGSSLGIDYDNTNTNIVTIGSTLPSASFGTSGLSGSTINVGGNFYNNGTNMNAGEFTLNIADNSASRPTLNTADNVTSSQWGNPYAVAFNMTVANSKASGGYVAASAREYPSETSQVQHHNVTAGTGNTHWQFTRPEITSAYTVYDDVVYVEFNIPIENSHGEINAAIARSALTKDDGSAWYNNAVLKFTGAYSDADCSSALSNSDVSSFYIRTTNTNGTWNTDATGTSAGNSQSTDRNGNHRSTIPDLTMLEGVLYAAEGKTMSINYNTKISTSAYTAVSDHCSPVLVAVYTGQELHTAYSNTANSQPPFDAHNFIEFQYSEAVDIGDLTADVSSAPSISGWYSGNGWVNKRAQISFDSASVHGGSIEVNGTGLTVTGFASIDSGSIDTGEKGSDSLDTTVSSLYRTFSTTASDTVQNQTHRIRISVAGYVDESNPITLTSNSLSYNNWIGYINSSTSPTGHVTRVSNDYIKDISSNTNTLDSTRTASIHALPTLSVNSTATELYGSWDSSAPIFAPNRALSTDWTGFNPSSYSGEYEIVGTSTSGGTVLDCIEFHMFDNTPSYYSSDSYTWYSKLGWCNGSDSSNVVGKAADLYGGSKAFSNAANKTSGGIRYSSLYNAHSAFMYSTTTTPLTNFGPSEITGGAQSSLFLTSTGSSNPTGSEDGLYFAVYFDSGSSFPLRTTFNISFDSSSCYITDLAGNRITRSFSSLHSVDRTPPLFNMTVAPVVDSSSPFCKKLFIVFSKRLNLDTIAWYSGSDLTTHDEYSALDYIPKALELVDGSGNPISNINIDVAKSAETIFVNSDATGLLVSLTENVKLSDLTNCYVRVKDVGTSIDPLTGISGSYVSYIQDTIGNYMTRYDGHAFSDFAVNVVQPQYAYDNRATDDGFDITSGLYEDGSWAVHDWNEEQQNYGTLLTNHDISIYSKLYDGTSDNTGGLPDGSSTKLNVYLDNSPDSNSVSTEVNERLGFDWRIWLPNVSVDGDYPIFNNLSPANNSDFVTLSENDISDNLLSLTLPVTTNSAYNGWVSGNQISFMFGVMNADGTPTSIIHNPSNTESGNSYTGTASPLYALRLKNTSDITSLDLWSFKLKDVTLQRGGATILNNVINVNAGEKTVVQVDMKKDGNLNVMVMTLDGNIVTYLQHGRTTAGTHYYRWDGKNNAGNKVARGLYFVRIVGPNIDETRKVMVVKE